LNEERPDVELWLVGESGQSTDQVKYLGMCNNVASILQEVDVVIHTPFARQGAHDLSVLEAMATGLPVVAYNVECVRDSFPNSDVGILVPYEDYDAAFRRVDELLNNSPDRRTQIGQAARKLVEKRFTIERIAEKYLQLYRSMISNQSIANALT
jgi:glycosyltransferase involved in cell wall biosynthesis